MADNPLEPKEGEKLDLKSASFRSKETGRYTRKVDVGAIIDSINILKPTTEKLNVNATALKEEVSTFKKVLFNILNIDNKPADVVAEKKPSTSTVKEGLEDLSSSSFNLAKLALLIPLLFNETTRNILSGFFEGMLEGLGFSKDTISLLKLVAAGAVMAFKLFLGYKVIKSVFDVFMAFKKLADATGILGLFTSKKNAELEIREQTVDLENNDLKKNSKKQRGIIKNLKTRAKVFMRKLKQFMNFKKLALGTLRAVKGLIRVVKTAVAWTGIGYLIGAAVDAGIGTLIDYYTKEGEKEEPETSGFEKVGKLFADNFIQSLTFGAVNLEDLKSMINGLMDAGMKKGIIPEWLGNKLKFSSAKTEPASKAPVTSTSTPSAKAQAPKELGTKDLKTSPMPAAKGATPVPGKVASLQSADSSSGAASITSSVSSSSTSATSSSSSSMMEPAETNTGQSLQTSSEETISAKKAMTGTVTNVINVDNSQNLHMEESKQSAPSPGVFFNSTVGA